MKLITLTIFSTLVGLVLNTRQPPIKTNNSQYKQADLMPTVAIFMDIPNYGVKGLYKWDDYIQENKKAISKWEDGIQKKRLNLRQNRLKRIAELEAMKYK